MIPRLLFFTLLVANLLFLAWVRWGVSDQSLPEIPRRDAAVTESPPPHSPATAADQTALPCASLGPFPDAAAQSRAAALLGAAGKAPRSRTETLPVNDGYWVFVADPRTAADPQPTLAAIRRAGIDDAYVIPDGPRVRIAVGMFHERSGAEQRAAELRRLQLEAVIEEHTRKEPRYWIDVPGETRDGLSASQRAQWGIKTEDLLTATCP